MEKHTTLCCFLIFLFPTFINGEFLETYIVQLHPNAQSLFTSKLQFHLSFLNQAMSNEDDPSSRLLYSYHSSFEGFSALLSNQEANFLNNHHDVVSIRRDRILQLHTTYSYKFLGLEKSNNGQSAWTQSGLGKGSIIGVLDTGVWPESPSFNDEGMDPVPEKWKGSCQQGQDFNSSNCNKKLIGAKFFIKGHHVANSNSNSGIVPEYISPRDSAGHGTHTSSTAGGSRVPGASVFGNGAGEARGMAPMAHIAVYKVCWFSGCYSSDILAGMDEAIIDGVHVLSLSLGGFPVPLYDDTIAIGSFRAMEKGISVVCAAGNNGPLVSSVANEAPWITTVGASTLDRKFPAYVRMGNGAYLYGESIYPGKIQKEVEVVYLSGLNSGSEFCIDGSLPESVVKGKIVICDRGVNGRAAKGEVVKKAGGLAMILANTELNLEEDSVDPHVLPATLIGYYEAARIKSYINSTKIPTARILFRGTVLGKARAPAVARFSSRGPSISNPSVIKPDMIAPGVNIIAAWPQNLGPTALPEDSRRVNFTIMSGTSMACPHVSGITALVRSAHPDWTSAAVKSAMMTSADVIDHYGKPIMDGNVVADPFSIGSGHVNPFKAMNPGLVYDIKPDDYVTHLCSLGYTRSEVFTITHRNVSCSEIMHKKKGFSLNYPSISVIFKKGVTRTEVKRRLTNVGRPGSAYSVQVKAPNGVKIVVRPKELVFKNVGQSLSYRVYVALKKKEGDYGGDKSSQGGYLAWTGCSERSNVVRSPIMVTRLSG